MKLSHKIRELEHKPVGTRIAILISTVAIVMAGVVGIWILQLRYELSDTSRDQAPSLFQSIRKSISDSVKQFK